MTMLAFGFVSTWWAAWVAAGAASLAVPILIHLIHQARAPRVPFPTLRFLRSAAERTARRRRIENLLLLALRLLLFAVLAAALARPFLSRAFGLFGGSSTAACIVLDNSYSMLVASDGPSASPGGKSAEAGRTRLANAKRETRALLESPWRPARAAVLLTNYGPTGPAPPPERLSADRARLFTDLDGAQAGAGRADLPAALKAAYALLDATDAADKRLWILTDRQALSWDGVETLEEPRAHSDIPVAVIRVTEPAFANIAVTQAEIVSRATVVGMPVRLDVTVAGSGPAAEKRSVLLYVDDAGQASQKATADLAPAAQAGATRVVALSHTFETPGPHRLVAAVEGTDSLALDNTRRAAVQVADRIPVLLVKEAPADVPFQDANFYLVRALDPSGGEADFPWAIRPTETSAASLDPSALAAWDAVFLNNVASLTPATARALADYVASGRTLVVFCGTAEAADACNRFLADGIPEEGGLLPARLGDVVGSAVLRTEAWKIASVQADSPYLEGLVESAEAYQEVLVYQYVRADPGPAGAATVLARLASGDPLILEKAFGRGRVLLLTTGATTAWTNLPVRNLFLPLMVRIAHLSARGRSERRDLLAGQPIEINLWPEVKEAATIELAGPLGPAGEIVTEQLDSEPGANANLVRFAKTWRPGFYAWRLPAKAGIEGVFAVNVDGAESDLTEIGDEALAARIGAREVHVAASFAELVERFEQTARRELWQYFLILCLVLAVLEPLLANWMRPRETHSPDKHHAPSKLGG